MNKDNKLMMEALKTKKLKLFKEFMAPSPGDPNTRTVKMTKKEVYQKEIIAIDRQLVDLDEGLDALVKSGIIDASLHNQLQQKQAAKAKALQDRKNELKNAIQMHGNELSDQEKVEIIDKSIHY
jgi:hypothetical protein